MGRKAGYKASGARIRRPDARRNAWPHRVALFSHGATSYALKHASLHRGSVLGRAYSRQVTVLTSHLGGELTAPQQRLVDQAARLSLLVALAWGELVRAGAFSTSGETRPAFDAFRRACADEREVLKQLGIERHAREITSVAAEVARQRAEEEADDIA